MFKIFRRVTSSGNYIPEIDGLRFIAIASVVFFHLNADIFKKSNIIYSDNKKEYSLLTYLFNHGDRGVPIFFAISGFILALPFANYYLNGTKKINLKKYFLRRLTRLEPPYILSLIILFLASIYVVKKLTAQQLFPSLISSFFYLNNITNSDGSSPVVSAVAWSLEIEVQFYILAPLIFQIFKLPLFSRRLLITSAIILLPVTQAFLSFPFKSIYDYLQYFAIGILLADLFAHPVIHRLPKNVSFIAGCLLFIIIWAIPGKNDFQNNDHFTLILLQFILLLAISGLFYLVLFTSTWKRIMSINVISIIGGMCYSVYLIHFAVISMVDRFTVTHKFTDFYILDLFIQFILITVVIGVICSVFFILIEKPCMYKDWPRRLWLFLRGNKIKVGITMLMLSLLLIAMV